MKHRAVALLTLAILLPSCFGACSSSSPADSGKMTIAVIPKGTSHVFWQSIHAGAAKAAQELGVDIIWRGPLREDDRASQIAEVEGFITRGVSGIVLAPLDEAALVGPVRRRGAREDSGRHHRLGAERRRLRQLRRDRQPAGWAAWRPKGWRRCCRKADAS